jgi:hypothetical protein
VQEKSTGGKTMSGEQTRTKKVDGIEDATDAFQWGRIARLVEEVLGVELQHTLKQGPELLRYFYPRLLQKQELLGRIECIKCQIDSPLPASSSRTENRDYMLGYYWAEQEFQDPSNK